MRKYPIFMIIAVCLFLCGADSFAQINSQQLDLPQEIGERRKEPGFFKRPSRETPAEQIKYAENIRAKGSLKKAGKAYRAVVHEWHDSPEAPAAQFEYANILLERGKLTKSFDEFQYMVDFFSGQFDYDAVLDKQFRVANEMMSRRYGDFLFFPGFASPERALPLLEQIVQNGPEWKGTPNAQFNIGLIHEQSKDYMEAIDAYELVVSRYSDSDYAAGSAFRRAHCLYLMSKRSPRDKAMCRKALSAVTGFIREYSGDPNEEAALQYKDDLNTRLSDLYYEIAVYYDKIAKKPESAIIAYSDFISTFPASKKAVAASRRREELQKQLETTNDEQ